MNNDTDKLRAELQAKMQIMTDELYSQLGVSKSMLSEGSCVSAEIHSATDAMDARIHGFLAGQQYESDMHRDMRANYAKLQDKYDTCVRYLRYAVNDLNYIFRSDSICGFCAAPCKQSYKSKCKDFIWTERKGAIEALGDNPISNEPTVEKFDNEPAYWISYGRDEKYNRYYKCSRCMHEIVIDTEFERYVGLPDTCEVCRAKMQK